MNGAKLGRRNEARIDLEYVRFLVEPEPANMLVREHEPFRAQGVGGAEVIGARPSRLHQGDRLAHTISFMVFIGAVCHSCHTYNE